jgi:thiol-disulfide isomerase/thioredoxin
LTVSAATRRSWIAVAAIAALLGVGTWLLVRFTSPPEGVQVGQRIPDYRVQRTATGDSIGLRTGYAGHVTLINIWATWCHPCLREMPSLEHLYRRYGDRGFRIAAVSIDATDSAPVVAFIRQLGLSFDILHDRSGEIQAAYRTVGVPTSLLVDTRGRIAYIALGANDWDAPDNIQRIDHLLAGAR